MALLSFGRRAGDILAGGMGWRVPYSKNFSLKTGKWKDFPDGIAQFQPAGG